MIVIMVQRRLRFKGVQRLHSGDPSLKVLLEAWGWIFFLGFMGLG